MLAARNHRFALAAVVSAVAWTPLCVAEVMWAYHLADDHALGGAVSGDVVRAASHIVGVVAWLLIASAFRVEIDWRRLRFGGNVLVATLFAYFVGTVLSLIAVFAETTTTEFRLSQVFGVLVALLELVALGVIVSGLAESRRGRARAVRLRLAACVGAASLVAGTVGVILLAADYPRYPAPEVLTIGLYVGAVGSFATAIAAGIFARGATRPWKRREAAVFAAGAAGVFATAIFVASEALTTIGYHQADYASWSITAGWLSVAYRVLLTVAFLSATLAARSALRAAPRPG